jgi:hypothetical protein
MALSIVLVVGVLVYTNRRKKRQAKAAEEVDESEMVELVW